MQDVRFFALNRIEAVHLRALMQVCHYFNYVLHCYDLPSPMCMDAGSSNLRSGFAVRLFYLDIDSPFVTPVVVKKNA